MVKTRECLFEGCTKTPHTRGHCTTHQWRIRKHGSTSLPTDLDRFMAKIEKQEDGCWTWTAQIDIGGYGNFKPAGKRTVKAHRFAFTEFVGPIPEGLQLDHLCRVRSCCNPDHLEPVTPKENLRRGLNGELKEECRNGHDYATHSRVNARGNRFCGLCSIEACARYRKRKMMELTSGMGDQS